MVGRERYSNPYTWRAANDLGRVIQTSGMIYASHDVMFQFAFFGRDSLEVAEDLLMIDPMVARRLLPKLASLQGTAHNALTEEEYGKIHHEHREVMIDGKKIPRKSRQILDGLADRWGLDKSSFTYYGAADTTPLYARVLARYVTGSDAAFLRHRVVTKDHETITMAQSLERALEHICHLIQRSANGLVEFRRQNKNGHICQVWKDSVTALQHADGKVANYHGYVATVDLQALAYDALIYGAEVLSSINAASPAKIDEWRHQAALLQQCMLQTYWLASEARFATGHDYDQAGKLRLITTPTSNQGVILNSRVLLNLDDADREKYVASILQNIYSDEFLTEVGVRCRAKSYQHVVDFEDYHGAWAVWPKETYDIAKGMRMHGLEAAAQQLEHRILRGTNKVGNRELFYVAPDGAVAWRLLPINRINRRLPIRQERIIRGTNLPESSQAWTSSASFAIRMQQRHTTPVAKIDKHASSLARLEHELVTQHDSVVGAVSIKSVLEVIPTADDVFFIDIATGLKKQQVWERPFFGTVA